MNLFVLVRPVPDEPFRVTLDRIDAAQDWLDRHVAAKIFLGYREFVQTGGWVRVAVPPGMSADDARAWFEELWRGYPLRETITWTVDIEVERPGDGFDTLRAAVREQRPVTA
jgi:hypothetical protein